MHIWCGNICFDVWWFVWEDFWEPCLPKIPNVMPNVGFVIRKSIGKSMV